MASSASDGQMSAEEKAVAMWTLKKSLQKLESARGNGTSMISLVIPPKDQISRVNSMLTNEMGTATNIKSRVNRLSVLSAITSVQQRLKNYSRVPDNGLVIYCGTVMTDENKEKKLSMDIIPHRPINTSLYMCDSRFHTEALRALLDDAQTFGFIVVDGNGALYGTLSGNVRTILHKFTVDLPKKHGRGGQSALRFARLRLEKRHNYVRKVAEVATQCFITNDRPNVAGLILAGSAEFKQKLAGSDLFDPRLLEVVVAIVDVSYGGENGFNQAIELAADSLADVKFVAEKRLLAQYYSEISQDTGKFCFGVKDTMTALDLGAAETLILYEDLAHNRYEMHNPATGETVNKILSPEEEKDPSHFHDAVNGVELEVRDKMPVVEWLALHYKDFGARLEFVTDKSQEGSQFVKGFGGMGALLRYQVDFANHDFDELDNDNFSDGDDDFF